MLTHTAADGKPFSCQLCDNKYTRRDTLNIHMKKVHTDANTTTGDKERYQCRQCNNTFSRKDTLGKHIRNIHAQQLGHLPLPDLVEYSLEEEM